MPASKETVMILMNRVRKALDNPDLDFVHNEVDVMTAVLTYGIHFKYLTKDQWMNSPASYRIGGNPDGAVLVVTDSHLSMEWMRARVLCFAILKQLGLSLSEQEGK
jgi:hypothetical protein